MLSRQGVALIELVMAMTIASIVLGGSTVLLLQVTAASTATAAAADTALAADNGERFLRTLLLEIDSSQSPLRGTPSAVAFDSRCVTPHGWSERCHVSVRPNDHDGLEIALDAQGRVRTLDIPVQGRRFVYLLSAAEGGTWLPEWNFALTLPAALGVVQGSDTILIRIGLEPSR